MPESPGWRLVDFSEHLERWIEQDGPSIDLRVVVIDWLSTRADDPYQGVRRWPEADAWWHVLCRGLATLDLPF